MHPPTALEAQLESEVARGGFWGSGTLSFQHTCGSEGLEPITKSGGWRTGVSSGRPGLHLIQWGLPLASGKPGTEGSRQFGEGTTRLQTLPYQWPLIISGFLLLYLMGTRIGLFTDTAVGSDCRLSLRKPGEKGLLHVRPQT